MNEQDVLSAFSSTVNAALSIVMQRSKENQALAKDAEEMLSRLFKQISSKITNL